MKATIEPKKFKNILSAAMVGGIIDPVRIVAKKNGILAFNATDTQDVVSIVSAGKGYFNSYTCDKTEEFAFDPEVLKRVSWGFKQDEMAIETTKDTMRLTDGVDNLPVQLCEPIPIETQVPITKTEYGLFLDRNLYKELKAQKTKKRPSDWDDHFVFENYYIYKTDAKELKFPGSPLDYPIILKEGKLSVKIPGVSTSFGHQVPGEQLDKNGDINITLDAEDFKSIALNLEGEVMLIFDDKMVSFLEQNNEGIFKTLSLGTKIERD